MKRLIIGAAIAMLLGSPALAQSYNAGAGSGNIVPPINKGTDRVGTEVYGPVPGYASAPNESSPYAYVPNGRVHHRRHVHKH